jgi:hypothetical protein
VVEHIGAKARFAGPDRNDLLEACGVGDEVVVATAARSTAAAILENIDTDETPFTFASQTQCSIHCLRIFVLHLLYIPSHFITWLV